jgi:glutamine synthetase
VAELRDFLQLTYDELEQLNLKVREERIARISEEDAKEKRVKYLTDEKRIKAVTICFTDLEGRLHMLDYDKKFLLKNLDNLSFDGSSIRGFSLQHESDLRLKVDWAAFYWLPSDVFGPGKVLAFAEVCSRDGSAYSADMRGQLRAYMNKIYKESETVVYAANEIEGFLFKGKDAERHYHETGKFDFISTGGYYHSLPTDPLRQFIDRAAEAQRAMGFCNEKDHPEVAPSQFEMNYTYSEMLMAADQVQLYKLLCRQVAHNLDMTASFLPKPVTGVNGNGMHTNISVGKKKKNLFYDEKGPDRLSKVGWDFVDRILNNADDICLVLNPSVNAYRRLDPHYEAPNQIKVSANNRGAMVRIPWGNEGSSRIEVRSVAPDANPYMVMYVLAKAGLEGSVSDASDTDKRTRTRFLPDNIYDAVKSFKQSRFMSDILTESVQGRFTDLKIAQADRCPKSLGTLIKKEEVQFHHEVTNQFLWSKF